MKTLLYFGVGVLYAFLATLILCLNAMMQGTQLTWLTFSETIGTLIVVTVLVLLAKPQGTLRFNIGKAVLRLSLGTTLEAQSETKVKEENPPNGVQRLTFSPGDRVLILGGPKSGKTTFKHKILSLLDSCLVPCTDLGKPCKVSWTMGVLSIQIAEKQGFPPNVPLSWLEDPSYVFLLKDGEATLIKSRDLYTGKVEITDNGIFVRAEA